MGAGDPERVHQPHGVRRHRLERIGRNRAPARLRGRHQRADVRDPEFGKKVERPMSRLSNRTTRSPRRDEAFAKGVRPAGQRRREAMDQQDRGLALPPEALIGDVDPVGADARHGGSDV